MRSPRTVMSFGVPGGPACSVGGAEVLGEEGHTPLFSGFRRDQTGRPGGPGIPGASGSPVTPTVTLAVSLTVFIR